MKGHGEGAAVGRGEEIVSLKMVGGREQANGRGQEEIRQKEGEEMGAL